MKFGKQKQQDKEELRKHIKQELEVYLKKGGTITLLPPEISLSSPSLDINYGGWGWEQNSGHGIYPINDLSQYENMNQKEKGNEL